MPSEQPPKSTEETSKHTMQLVVLAVALLTMLPTQVRVQPVSPEEEAQFNASVERWGILSPIGVRFDGKHYRVIWGHRRLKAAIACGRKEVPCVILDKDMTESEFLTIQLIENVQRSNISQHDLWQGCVRLVEASPGMGQAELGKALSLSQPTISKALSPSKCSADWQAALKAGKVSLGDCATASRLPEAEQAGLLALRLSGATRDEVIAAARKPRAVATTPTVKLSRVKCPLSRGTVVTVSGPEMSLEQYLEALTQAREAAQKSLKDQLDIRTAEKVWRDRAKAGT